MTAPHLAEALAAFHAGRKDEAQRILSASPALAPVPPALRPAEAWAMMAAVLMERGEYDEAELAASEAVTLQPDNARIRILRSRVLGCGGRLDDATGEARAAVRVAPQDFDASLQLIISFLNGGLAHCALDEARAYVERTGGAPEAASLLGLVQRRAGQMAEAERTLRKVLTAQPGLLQARLWLAHTLHDRGDNAEAAKLYTAVIAQAPGAEEAHYGLVNTLADAGKVREAAEAYSRACRMLPGFNQRWPEFVIPADLLSAPPVRSPQPEAGGLSMVLAFVPFDRPVIPLPPAALKAYVETHTPHRVTTIDLNARFFQAVRRALAEKRTPFELADNAAFLAAADLLSTDSPEFFDTAGYDPAATAFYEQLSALKTLFMEQGKRTEQMHGPIPWHARALARAMVEAKPRVIGLSAMFDTQGFAVHALARAIRSLDPAIRIVLGGSAFARDGIEYVLGAHYVDYIALHDGEEILEALLNSLAAGQAWPQFPGLCYRREDGSFEIDENTKPIQQKKIPAANFDDYDLDAYFNPRPVLPVLTSRGCYWRRCTFCNAFNTYAGIYTAQTIDHVAKEMESHVNRYGVRHFYLVDKIISAARYRKMSEAILELGLDVTFYGLAKPSAEFTPEIAETAFRAGLRYLHWGQESGSDRILAAMDKGNTVAASRAAYTATAQAGIRNHLFMIVGFPTEGIKELGETVDFITGSADLIDQIQCGPFILEKGTPLYSNPEQFGITRIIERRSTGRMQVMKFRTESGFTAEQTEIMEKLLRVSLLQYISPISKAMGIFWDHALIHYSETPRPELRHHIPSRDEVMATLHKALDDLEAKAKVA